MRSDPVMTRFDAQLLKSFSHLALAVRHRGGCRLLHKRRVRLPGTGAEATDLRDYVPGDDYRYIDWNLCARRGEILSKVFAGKEDRPMYVLVDCSSSMAFGQGAKLAAARQIASLLGCVAIADEERIGVAAFSGRIVAELPPVFGKCNVARWLQFVNRINGDESPKDLARVADCWLRRCRRTGPVIVLSDLCDPAGFQRGLDLLRHGGCDPRIVHLYDPLDAEPDLLGDVELFDLHDKTAWNVTVTERALGEYRVLFAEFLKSVRDYCLRHASVCVQLSTAMPAEQWYRETLSLGPCGKGSRL